MNQWQDEPIEVEKPQVERGRSMFGIWVLGYLIPALFGLVLVSWKNGAQKEAEQRRLQGETREWREGAKHRIQAGEATDVDLVLMGVDREKYARYKQQLDARAAKEAGNVDAESNAP